MVGSETMVVNFKACLRERWQRTLKHWECELKLQTKKKRFEQEGFSPCDTITTRFWDFPEYLTLAVARENADGSVNESLLSIRPTLNLKELVLACFILILPDSVVLELTF